MSWRAAGAPGDVSCKVAAKTPYIWYPRKLEDKGGKRGCDLQHLVGSDHGEGSKAMLPAHSALQIPLGPER